MSGGILNVDLQLNKLCINMIAYNMLFTSFIPLFPVLRRSENKRIALDIFFLCITVCAVYCDLHTLSDYPP